MERMIHTAKRQRIQTIDFLRGLVMIVMALDHTRHFFHIGANSDQNPLDFSTTSPILFLTRLVTHFCAPIFVFLSGMSVFLYSQGKSKKEVSWFLFTRGIWLMLIEILVITPIWDFNIVFVGLQVIWAIGLSMVILSALIFLPRTFLAILGIAIIVGHNLLDNVTMNDDSVPSFFWALFHQSHIFKISPTLMVGVMYPFIPWLGLMITGYLLGIVYTPSFEPDRRRRLLLIAGLSAIGIFIALRAINIYGDMHHWQHQQTSVFTILDFFNTTKYPPSLLYILMTVGPALVLLSLLEGMNNWLSRKIIVFGRVPFFYYIMHILVIHVFSWLTFFITGHSFNELDFSHFRNGSVPFGWGLHLWTTYLIWIGIVILLYFPCSWYNNYKSTHRQWWLSYL